MSLRDNIPQEGKKPLPAELLEDMEETAILGIRVPLPHYLVYKKQLTGSQKEEIRRVLRNTFIYLVENHEDLKGSKINEINVPVKINIIEQVEGDFLKVKKMIDKYEKELAKCIEERMAFKEENDSLKHENESLKKKMEELESQLKQLTQVQAPPQAVDRKIEERLNMLIEWLITAYYCIEYSNECKREDVKKNIMIILGDHKVDNEVFERVRMRFRNLYTIMNIPPPSSTSYLSTLMNTG